MDTFGFPTGLPDGALDMVLGAVGGLIAAVIAYWFGVRRDIAKLKAELKYQRTAAHFDRRDQVLHALWKSVQSALSNAAVATSMIKQYPDFKRLSDEAAKEILESSPLTERQRKELLESPDRTKYCQNAIFWHELHQARGSLYDLNKGFLENKIYVPSDFAEVIAKFIKTLNDVFISYEIWYESKEPELMKRARSEIKQAEALEKEIESSMRSIIREPDES